MHASAPLSPLDEEKGYSSKNNLKTECSNIGNPIPDKSLTKGRKTTLKKFQSMKQAGFRK